MQHNLVPLIVVAVFNIILLMLHILGIYCLYKQKRRKDTQKYLLLQLSAVEIALAVVTVYPNVGETLDWYLSKLQTSMLPLLLSYYFII